LEATTATILVITGSAIFLVGAAIGVSRVFIEPDPAEKLRMLEGRVTQWRVAQPLYAIGPMTVAIGVGFLAASSDTTGGKVCLALSCLALATGVLCWSRSLYLRFRYVRQFALGQLPGWSFAYYVWLTLVGLAALGIGQLLAAYPAWSGWLTLAGFVTFLVGYARYGDIPPFVFYLLLPIVSAGWV
jgi:hypothetical protein